MEAELIEWLKEHLTADERLWCGVGDDAAVVDWSASDHCVLTTDLLADGVHFRWGEVPPQSIGRKAVAVNLSDLAAMAARPVAIVVSLLLPTRGTTHNGRPMELSDVQQMYAGMIGLAEEFEFNIAGGDTNTWPGDLVLSITACGYCDDEPVRRSGARPGDHVLVTGTLGGSRAGHQFEFTPRIREALRLNRDYGIHAAIDISDGLALDASRLAAASGCGIALELNDVPVSQAAVQMQAADPSGPTALERALGDGEDFELLLAVSAEEAERLLADQPLSIPLTRIGRAVQQPGLWQLAADGARLPLNPGGYWHD